MFISVKTLKDIRDFWIEVIAQIRCIDTGISSKFLFIKRLNQLKRIIGRE